MRSRELIYRRETSAFTDSREFIFKHDILREVTYESVIKRLRRIYHGMVADWLIVQDPERAKEYLGMIAKPLARAGRTEQTREYFLQAGQSALDRYANAEAEINFKKVVELSPNKRQLADGLKGLGIARGRMGSINEATQNMRQAINLFDEFGGQDSVAELYTQLSRILFNKGYELAWEACQAIRLR